MQGTVAQRGATTREEKLPRHVRLMLRLSRRDLPAPVCGVTVERAIEVPAGDGVVLLTDHYRPQLAGPAPTLLVRSPYGRNLMWAPAISVTPNGRWRPAAPGTAGHGRPGRLERLLRLPVPGRRLRPASHPDRHRHDAVDGTRFPAVPAGHGPAAAPAPAGRAGPPAYRRLPAGLRPPGRFLRAVAGPSRPRRSVLDAPARPAGRGPGRARQPALRLAGPGPGADPGRVRPAPRGGTPSAADRRPLEPRVGVHRGPAPGLR